MAWVVEFSVTSSSYQIALNQDLTGGPIRAIWDNSNRIAMFYNFL
jgi:hypothetical protein